MLQVQVPAFTIPLLGIPFHFLVNIRAI